MTVDYKIRIDNGGVSITQHVDTAAPCASVTPAAVGGTFTLLPTSFVACNATAAARGAGQGGNAPGDTGPGGNAPGDTGPGGNAPGDTGPGGGAGQGQIVVFGPVVVDAAGLIHKSLTEQRSEEKHEEK